MIDKLYDYQAKAERDIREAWKKHRRVLLVLPTGAGKTVVAAHIAAHHKGPVLVLAHRRELTQQAQRRLVSAGAPDSVQVMSVQAASAAITRGWELPPADLVVIDEAHHAPAKTWTGVLERYPSARVLGLTATPYRSDGAALGSCFDVIVHGPTYEELFESDKLAKPRVFSWAAPDLRDAKIERGDYAKGALKKYAKKRLGDLVAHWLRYSGGAPTVVYAVDVEDAKAIATRFNREGIRAAVLTGKTHVSERELLGHQLASGWLKVVVNVEVLTEGWDMPEVRCAMLARPTRSRALHRQMSGRVMRSGTTPLILDHCGNVPLLGYPWEHIDVALDRALPRTGKHGAVESQTRACPECGSAVSLGAQRCAYCDHVFWSKVPDEDASRWLVEMSGEDPRIERVLELHKNGLSDGEISRETAVPKNTVSHWIRARLGPRRRRNTAHGMIQSVARAAARVRNGESLADAARNESVSKKLVSRALRGQTGNLPSEDAQKQMRVRIVEAINSGMSRRATATATGASLALVAKVVNRHTRRRVYPGHVKDQVIELVKRGATVVDAAEKTGVNVYAAYEWCGRRKRTA